MKQNIFIISIIFIIQLFLNLQGNNDVRIILFNHTGQKETVKINEKISIVYGQSVKPEYTYLSYSNGKNRDEYIIELKSNEFLFKEISSNRKSIDSLKIEINNKPTKIDTIEIIKTIESPVKEKYNYPSISNFADSVKNEAYTRQKLNIISKIPKVSSAAEADSLMIKANNRVINQNESDIKRNINSIDSLNLIIAETQRTRKGLENLDNYYHEIDSLRSINFEMEQINIRLKHNNEILSADLRAKEAEYEALIRLIYLLLAIAVIVIIVALFLYISYKQKKKFNNELNRINNELEIINNNLFVSNNEKEKLLKIIRKELDLAANYVKSLLPNPINHGKIKTEWVYIPSAQLGGDAFGYSSLDDDTFVFYVLDVSGHGVGSALHSVQVLNILKNRTIPNVNFKNPHEVLTALNQLFQMSAYNGLYFTIFYATYNLSSRKLIYSSAGHPPMLLSHNGTILELSAQDVFIGAVPNLEYCSDEVILKQGSSIILFSDAAYEFKKNDAEMYTFNEFKNDINSLIIKHKKPLKAAYENARKICNTDELDDDFSMIKIDFSE